MIMAGNSCRQNTLSMVLDLVAISRTFNTLC